MTRRLSLLMVALLPAGAMVACGGNGQARRPANAPTAVAKAPANSVSPQARPSSVARNTPATRPSQVAINAPATRPTTRPSTRPTANTTEHFPAPPAPPLHIQQALSTFTLPPGFHIEPVAWEPNVEDPVAAAFDADGRLWVAEMRGYMPDAYAHHEDALIGRIVVLESTHNDGHFDKRTVFLDNLYLPRAISPVDGGVLVGSPPHLWYCHATPDLHCDKKIEVSNKYGIARDPEYGDNGLLWARDNWIYNANSTVRFHEVGNGQFESGPTAHRGQWGITQDDDGRLYFNYNSDQLRSDLIPTDYLARNPDFKPTGGNVQIEKDQRVWSNRPNPGINRGYEPGNLRKNGHLNTVTATCGPTIFRGTALGDDCYGNAFIPEPTGNLVMRKRLMESDGMIQVQPVLHEQNGQTLDFLCSTDERFRPVNTFTGPDGALYIIDMYRGLIQHQVYLTPYLRHQVFERGLDQPLHMGRIYRVVKDGATLTKLPKMSTESAAQVVEDLSNPNGWWRDTAQRLLVERKDPAAVPLLKKLAIEGTHPLARLGALWTLQGMDEIDLPTLRSALADSDPRVASAALRLSEPYMVVRRGKGMLDDVLKLADRDDVRLQFVLTISGQTNEKAEEALATVLAAHADKPFIRDAALSGLYGREWDFLNRLLNDPQWQTESKPRASVLGGLAMCIFNEGNRDKVTKLVDLMVTPSVQAPWHQSALLDAVAAMAKAPGRKPKVALDAAPQALVKLEEGSDKHVADRAKAVVALLKWPGKPGENDKPKRELTATQQASFDRGKIVFTNVCAQCHQADGQGIEGKAPSLRESPFALGPDVRLVRIVLNGAKGEFKVAGYTPNQEMPTLAVLSDQQIADVLTYIRHEWEHDASPVSSRTVSRIRGEVGDRQAAWTEKELLAIPAPRAARRPQTRPANRAEASTLK